MNVKTQIHIQQKISHFELPDKYIGIHIRKGGKITSQEMQEIHLDKYVNTILRHKDVSTNVYVATNDVSIIQDIKEKLESQGICIYYNNLHKSQGFNESDFNHADKQTRYQETINVLLDMEVLIQSSFFIGTYTSNLSRVVPFFLGLDKCISLDNDWNIINSMNRM